MDCGQIQTLYTAYTDQELDEHNLLLFEKHLRACPRCQREWEDFRKILHRLAAVEPLPAPSGLLPGIHEKLARPGIGNRLAQAFHKILAPISLTAGASAMAAAMLIVFLVSPGSAPGPNAPNTSSPEGIALQEPLSAYLPPPLATIPISLDTGMSRRPADQLSLTSSMLSGQTAGSDRSAQLFYQYLLNREQTYSGHATGWQQRFESADAGLFIPRSHIQQIGMPLMPDITIRLPHLSPDGLDRLHSHIKETGAWQTRCYHHDYFVVLLNPGDIEVLYSLLQQHHLPFSSHSTQEADRLSRKPLLVAIRL
jgi:hypothetical protein